MVLPSECPGSRYLIICSVVRSALRTQSESVCTRHAIPQKQEPGMPRDARHMQCTAQGRVLGSTIFVDGQLTVLTQTKKKKKRTLHGLGNTPNIQQQTHKIHTRQCTTQGSRLIDAASSLDRPDRPAKSAQWHGDPAGVAASGGRASGRRRGSFG